jgi:hypothetical protein
MYHAFANLVTGFEIPLCFTAIDATFVTYFPAPEFFGFGHVHATGDTRFNHVNHQCGDVILRLQIALC